MRLITSILAGVLCTLTAPALAQTPDSVMEARMPRRVLTCSDIVLNATYLLPHYHDAGRQDSIEAVLDFVQRRCGPYAGQVEHYKMLYAVDTSGRLDTSTRRNNILEMVLAYRRAFFPEDPDTKYGYGYWSYYHYREGSTAPPYFPFLKSYGATLAARPDLAPDAAWVARYYASGADTSLLQALDSPAYRGTRLQREYRVYRRQLRAERTVYVAGASGGYWSPQGALSLLGPKGFAGFEMAGWGPRLAVTGYFYGIFGRSRTPYNTLFRDTLFTTDHFFGGGLGLRGDYAVWKESNVEATAGLSLGYESISVIKDETPNNDVNDGKHLPSFNLAPGVGVNYYFSPSMFLHFFGRYHIVNFRNEAPGTAFSGNALMFGVGIGGGSDLRERRMGSE